jgi:hypothetical protein
MRRFLVLYHSSVSASEQMANASPEEMKAGMEAWMAWASRSGDAIVDLGMPLGNPRRITPGTASGSDSDVSGYSIIQAESEDAAVELLRDHPHLQMPSESSIEVLASLRMPGM